MSNRGNHEQHVKAGKAGAAARWGRNNDDDNDNNDNEDEDNSNRGRRQSHGSGRQGNFGNHEQHVKAGKAGAAARWGKNDNDNDDDMGDDDNDMGSSSRGGHQGNFGNHEQHVKAGKAGAAARWGKNYNNQDNNDNDNDNDYGNDGGDDDYGRKDPRRVQAGKKAAATRGHESLAEAGRKGGQHSHSGSGGSGAGKRLSSGGSRNGDYDPESDKYGYDWGEEGEEESSSNRGRQSTGRGRGGQHNRGKRFEVDPSEDATQPEDMEEDEGASLGGDFAPGKNPTRQAVSRRIARDRGYEALAEQGRKGGHGNAGIHADMDFDDMESYLDNPEMGVPAKDPRRVAAGKKAAQSRNHEDMSEQGRRGGLSNRGHPKFGGTSGMADEEGDFRQSDAKDPNRQRGGQKAAAQQSHESFVQRGKMGAAARWGNDYGSGSGSGGRGRGGNQNDEDYDEDNNEDYHGKNPNRVAGGKRAASHFSSEELSKRGKRGAAARWGGNMNDEDEDNEQEEDNDYGQQRRSQGRFSQGQSSQRMVGVY